MKRLLLATAILMAATPAFAETGQEATVLFEGNVNTICEIRNYDGNIDFGNLNPNNGASPNRTDNVSVFCNVPFAAEVSSTFGLLKHVSENPIDQDTLESDEYAGFAAAVDYQVNITSSGNYGSLAGTVDTTEIGQGQTINLGSNFDPINQTATLVYSTVPGTLPMLAGAYSDTVTVSLTPGSF